MFYITLDVRVFGYEPEIDDTNKEETRWIFGNALYQSLFCRSDDKAVEKLAEELSDFHRMVFSPYRVYDDEEQQDMCPGISSFVKNGDLSIPPWKIHSAKWELEKTEKRDDERDENDEKYPDCYVLYGKVTLKVSLFTLRLKDGSEVVLSNDNFADEFTFIFNHWSYYAVAEGWLDVGYVITARGVLYTEKLL